MSDAGIQDRNEVRSYVEILQYLIADIGASMDAISRNALPELELSLWKQETSCASLKRLLRNPEPARDQEALLLLRKELELFRTVTRSYDAVVRRAHGSTSLLMDLCSFHAAHSIPKTISWEA